MIGQTIFKHKLTNEKLVAVRMETREFELVGEPEKELLPGVVFENLETKEQRFLTDHAIERLLDFS